MAQIKKLISTETYDFNNNKVNKCLYVASHNIIGICDGSEYSPRSNNIEMKMFSDDVDLLIEKLKEFKNDNYQ